MGIIKKEITKLPTPEDLKRGFAPWTASGGEKDPKYEEDIKCIDGLCETDGDDFEEMLSKLEEKNNEYLATFSSWLEAKGLKEKTISNHIFNVDTFLNDYVAYYEGETMQKGIHLIGGFLGDWFIRKCMWSTPNSVKSNAASIKKFYQCMMEEQLISKEMFQKVKTTIKEDLPFWMEDCERYNDFDEEDEEWW